MAESAERAWQQKDGVVLFADLTSRSCWKRHCSGAAKPSTDRAALSGVFCHYASLLTVRSFLDSAALLTLADRN